MQRKRKDLTCPYMSSNVTVLSQQNSNEELLILMTHDEEVPHPQLMLRADLVVCLQKMHENTLHAQCFLGKDSEFSGFRVSEFRFGVLEFQGLRF